MNTLRSARPHRRQFIDKALLYVLSFDVEVDADRHEFGFVAGGVRLNVFTRPGLSRAYNLHRSRTLAGFGFERIDGAVVWGSDSIYWREDDIEQTQIRASVRTDDGVWIHFTYPLIAYLGPGGFRHLVSEKERIGKESAPVLFPIVSSPRFETANPNYRWLSDQQCIGFGLVQLIRSEIRRLTYDVYAMT
jgi:Protein of unknown function (DUF3237)